MTVEMEKAYANKGTQAPLRAYYLVYYSRKLRIALGHF